MSRAGEALARRGINPLPDYLRVVLVAPRQPLQRAALACRRVPPELPEPLELLELLELPEPPEPLEPPCWPVRLSSFLWLWRPASALCCSGDATTCCFPSCYRYRFPLIAALLATLRATAAWVAGCHLHVYRHQG